MPPLLALVLGAVLVIFLLRLDRRRSPGVTQALWIPTIWMLYIASKPIGIWFQAQSANPDAGSPMDRIFLTALMLLALVVLYRRRVDWARVIRQNRWLVLLIAFMLISVIWSNIPLISFKRWIREFQAVLMALVIVSEPWPREAMESLLRRVTYVVVPMSLILIKYFPFYGVDYGPWSGEQMWIGVALQKNGLALICIISAVFLIWSLIKSRREDSPRGLRYRRPIDFLVLLLTLYILGGPRHSVFYSATSTYACAAGLIVCALVYIRERSGRRVREGYLVALMSFVIVLGVASVYARGSGIRFLASSAGRDATLTGRTEVWASLLPVVKANPLLGTGFGGFWTSKTRDFYAISGAHSGYLDVLLGLGFAGIILASAFLLSSGKRARREIPGDLLWGLAWLCYLVMSVVHNVGESSLDTFTSPLTAILLIFAVSSVPTPAKENEALSAEATRSYR